MNPFKTGDTVQPKPYSGTELDETIAYKVERVAGDYLDLLGTKIKRLHHQKFIAVSTPRPEPAFDWSDADKNWKPNGKKGLDGTEKPSDWQGLSTEKAALAEASVTDDVPPAAPLKGQAGGLKYDAGKDQWSLLLSAKGMLAALTGVVRVLMFGAKKYEAHSWRGVEDNERRYMDGLMRHYAAILEHGLDSVDPESGLMHIDHLNCNGLFLAELARKATS